MKTVSSRSEMVCTGTAPTAGTGFPFSPMGKSSRFFVRPDCHSKDGYSMGFLLVFGGNQRRRCGVGSRILLWGTAISKQE
jgi:hypothetical protein